MKRFIALQSALKLWLASRALALVFVGWCSIPPAWAAWNFVHITDIHVDTTNTDVYGQSFGNMMAKIRTLSPSPAFVIASGDLVDHALKGNDGVVDSANWRCLTRKMVKVGNTWYVPNSSGGSTGIPIYFTPGNHDDRNDIFPKWTNKNLNGYDQYIGYKSGTPPVSPTGVACTFGTGDAARDYYFTYNNAVIVSMYSGTDQGVDVINPSSYGMTNSKLALLSQALRNNIAAPVKIVFMHNPAADANGTDITGGQNYTKVWRVEDGCIWYGRTAFCDTLDACRITMSGTTYWPVAFHGHVEQKVVCDRNGTIRDRNWTGGVRYIQTDACKDGAYRIINITDANPNFATAEEQAINPTNPSLRILTPITGTLALGNAFLTVDVGAWDADMINNVEVSVNGTLAQTLTSLPYVTNVVVPEANQNCVITAKAFDKLGNSNTASVMINKDISTNTYYDRLNVGSTANVNCPKCKGTMSATLSDIRINGTRQAVLATNCACGGWTRYINVETVLRLTGSGTEPGLFAYPARIFDGGGLRCADIMIAPYQYPTVDIVFPVPGQETNKCEVKLATNYSGNGVSWSNTTASAPNISGVLKMNSWNYTNTGATGSTVNDYFTWDMVLPANTDPRTLKVKIKDVFGDTVSTSVSVKYNSAMAFRIFRGEFGDFWTHPTAAEAPSWLYCYNNPNGPGNSYPVCVGYNYWNGTDPMGTHYGGSFSARTRDELISKIAASMAAGPLAQQVPGGSTPVYVVDKTQYTSGVVPGSAGSDFGAIYFKEVYDCLALMLGRDSEGKTRVWASTSAGTRSVNDAIADVEPPVVSIEGLPNYAIVAPSMAIPININAYDFSGITKVELYVDGALKGTDNATSPYVITWTTPAADAYDKDYTIAAKAYGNDGRITVTPTITVTIKGTIVNTVINGGFESRGGWIDGSGNLSCMDVSLSPPNGRIWVTYRFDCPASASLYQNNIYVPLNAAVLKYRRTYSLGAMLGFRAWINNSCVEYAYSGGMANSSLYADWAECTVDMIPYRGQTITLSYDLFRPWTQYSNYTWGGSCNVDDVRIETPMDDFTVNPETKYIWYGSAHSWTSNMVQCSSGNSPYYTALETRNLGMADGTVQTDFTIDNDVSGYGCVHAFTRVTPNTDPGSVNSYVGIIGSTAGNGSWDGIWKTVNGSWTKLASASYADVAKPALGTWHTVKLNTKGTATSLYLDGILIAFATDASVSTAGDVAVQPTYGNGKIDNLIVLIEKTGMPGKNNGATGNKFPPMNMAANSGTFSTATQLVHCTPNPFAGQTAINFQLAEPAQTTIVVYNVSGQKVKTLVNECLRPGYHSVMWNGKSDNGQKVAAGVYFCRMSARGGSAYGGQAGNYSATRNLTVLR